MTAARPPLLAVLALPFLLSGCSQPTPPTAPASPQPVTYDVILANGRVVDGTGAPWFGADVAIAGDRIAAIGNLKDAAAKQRIDASGLVVAPGFIDLLGQSEFNVLVDNRVASKITQGVTTEITGEGGSIAPVSDRMIADAKAPYDHFKVTHDWHSLREYFARIERSKSAVNIGTFVGSGGIRDYVVGKEDRPATPAELTEMKNLVSQAMQDGALGVEADASREDVLKRVGIDRARGLIAAVGTDAENVYAVLSARVMRPDLFIVGRAETEDATVKLKRAGADRVLSPYQIGGVQMAQTALRPAVVDFFELATSADNLELAMEEITIAKTSALADQSILSANLRQRYGVIVVGIQREDRRMEFNPEPDTLIRPGDKLVVLGRPESLKKLEAHAAEAKS